RPIRHVRAQSERTGHEQPARPNPYRGGTDYNTRRNAWRKAPSVRAVARSWYDGLRDDERRSEDGGSAQPGGVPKVAGGHSTEGRAHADAARPEAHRANVSGQEVLRLLGPRGLQVRLS